LISPLTKFSLDKQTNNKMSFTTDDILSALNGLMVNWYDDEKRDYGECYGEEADSEEEHEDEDDIPTKDLMSHNYRDLRVLGDGIKQLIEENKKLKEQCIELKNEKQKAMEPWLGDDWEETTLADWADDIEKQKAEITDDYQREIEALKEEIEELQTSLEEED